MRKKTKLVYGVGVNDADYKVREKVNGSIVICPHCHGNNEIQFSDMGDKFPCQYMNCEKEFYIKPFESYVELIKNKGA